MAKLKILKKNEICVLLCSANALKRPTGVRKQRVQNRMAYLASHFWRLSLGNLYALAKAMFASDGCKGTGPEAWGEGRERVYFE